MAAVRGSQLILNQPGAYRQRHGQPAERRIKNTTSAITKCTRYTAQKSREYTVRCVGSAVTSRQIFSATVRILFRPQTRSPGVVAARRLTCCTDIQSPQVMPSPEGCFWDSHYIIDTTARSKKQQAEMSRAMQWYEDTLVACEGRMR